MRLKRRKLFGINQTEAAFFLSGGEKSGGGSIASSAFLIDDL
jgi:hypothetical protein